jgi:hypothetical protein
MSIAGSNDLEFSGARSPSLNDDPHRRRASWNSNGRVYSRPIARMPVAKFHDHPDEPDHSRKYSASGQTVALTFPSDDATSLCDEYVFIYMATACESRMCSHRSHPEISGATSRTSAHPGAKLCHSKDRQTIRLVYDKIMIT